MQAFDKRTTGGPVQKYQNTVINLSKGLRKEREHEQKRGMDEVQVARFKAFYGEKYFKQPEG